MVFFDEWIIISKNVIYCTCVLVKVVPNPNYFIYAPVAC